MKNPKSAALQRIIREMDELEFGEGGGINGGAATEEYERGVSEAPAADRQASSLPASSSTPPASRPAEYRASVTDMPEQGAPKGSPAPAIPVPEAKDVPAPMAPGDRTETRLSNAVGNGDGEEKISKGRRRAMLRV